MIQMNVYSEDFKRVYKDKVFGCIEKKAREEIIKSTQNYFPKEFFDSKDIDELFGKLILAEYKELYKIFEHIQCKTKEKMNEECFKLDKKRTALYDSYYNMFKNVRDSFVDKEKLNVRIVRESGMITCPYCNRDYINSRGKRAAGAQLDHFFNRAKFPIFSLCLYNLIPSCGNCNRIKSSETETLLSPYDSEVDLDKQIIFGFGTYEPEKYDDIKIQITASKEMEKNVSVFKLREAYDIHSAEVQELVKKYDKYVSSQLDELCETIEVSGLKITKKEIKEMIFGMEIKPEQYGKRPLSKLKHDILLELGIF